MITLDPYVNPQLPWPQVGVESVDTCVLLALSRAEVASARRDAHREEQAAVAATAALDKVREHAHNTVNLSQKL